MPKVKPYPKRADAVFKDLRCRAPGVYADWPEAQYHADEAASASKFRNLIVGPAYFWVNSPWNPSWIFDADSTAAQIEGKAYHCRIFEGPAAFAKRFVSPPRRADYPDAVDGQAALKAECSKLGLKVGGSIAELQQRLKESGEFDGEFWTDILARWEADNAGRIRLKDDVRATVELVARICEQMPSLGEVWKRGKPEVSICWIDRRGIPMRTRLDYWAPGEIIEGKTLANQLKQPFHINCVRTIVNEFYHLQCEVERDGAEAALQMPDDMWHGFTPEEINAYRAAGVPDVRLLMIGKAAPDIFQRILAPEVPIEFTHWPDGRRVEGEIPREPSQLWRSAENIRDHMAARFKSGWEHFGRKPWFEDSAPIGLTDREPGLNTSALSRDAEV
jgi:hypothetical protein